MELWNWSWRAGVPTAEGRPPRDVSRRSAAAAEDAVRRPNFVFVVSDDQRWDAVGVVRKAVPENMHGRSWKALAAGRTPDAWRTSFVAHYYKELGPTPTCVALRTADAKLVVYPGHPEWTEVFDLEADPYEMRNLASDTRLREALRGELDTRMSEIELAMP